MIQSRGSFTSLKLGWMCFYSGYVQHFALWDVLWWNSTGVRYCGYFGYDVKGGVVILFAFGTVKRGNGKLCRRTFLEVSSNTESIK